MSTIHLHQTTTSTPELYVAGLTDFGPGRSGKPGQTAHDPSLTGISQRSYSSIRQTLEGVFVTDGT
jgi:hypothetical protein